MPIRIAFVVGQLGLGGAEQQLYYLLSGLDRSRFHPFVITLGVGANEYWEEPIRRLGILVRRISHSYGRGFRVISIANLLHLEHVQIVHSWDLHTNPYALIAARLSGVPRCIGSMRFNYKVISKHKLLRWAGYRSLDVLITNSLAAERQVQKLQLTSATVCMVPNGVYIPEPINESERMCLKSTLGVSNSESLIGSVGRLDHNKNYPMLLRVFGSLSEKWPTLRLVIIGDGPLKPQLVGMAETLGVASKVYFPGAIPMAARYLPAMDVCCLTSYTEGMPNIIMEAAAAEVPVVSTNCGGSVELIEHGESGFLVSPDDDGSMSAYLNLLLGDSEKRRRMGQMGGKKMRREFSIGKMVTRMMKLYEGIVQGPSIAESEI